MKFIVDCFAAVFNCVTAPPGPTPAPEINIHTGAAAVALLVCVTLIAYRQTRA